MLVLASNSPRRRELLALGGWDFTVQACEVDESVRSGEHPQDYVLRLASSKARGALLRLSPELRERVVILAADTTVVDRSDASPSGFEILGKPISTADAAHMLRRLRDRVHQVYTGLALLHSGDAIHTEAAVTEVRMRAYTDDEIQSYLHTGDPMDKAGAYGIQHAGFQPVSNLHGCYPNVMGLPLCRVAALLSAIGLPPRAEVFDACRSDGALPCRVYRLATAADKY